MKISKLSYILTVLVFGFSQSVYAVAQNNKTKTKKTATATPSLYYSGTSNGGDFEKMVVDMESGQWNQMTTVPEQGDG